VEKLKDTQFAVELARLASDLKCEDITALDLTDISPVTNKVVICTGTSDRQMDAVADQMLEYGRQVGERPYGVSGRGAGTWTLIDFVDVVVHIFARAYREYYDLELLWGDAPRIDWAPAEPT